MIAHCALNDGRRSFSGSLRKDAASHQYDQISPSNSASVFNFGGDQQKAVPVADELYVEPNSMDGSRPVSDESAFCCSDES